MIGNGSIAWQDPEGYGLYAKAKVNASISDGGWHLILPEGLSAMWQIAARFAYAYLCEELECHNFRGNGYQLELVELNTQPCDSTIIAVTYAVYIAMHQALNLNFDPAFYFDEYSGHFILRGIISEGKIEE